MEDLSAFCGENGCNSSGMRACDDASVTAGR
jgi:hypothetical protein